MPYPDISELADTGLVNSLTPTEQSKIEELRQQLPVAASNIIDTVWRTVHPKII